MARFVFTRLLQSLAALAILSVVVFVLARATGDPLHLILPMSATEEDYANARKYLGLDRPYVAQYVSFVGAHSPVISAPPCARPTNEKYCATYGRSRPRYFRAFA